MPFGKYKGEELINLPPNYLTYALIEFDLHQELKESMLKILLMHLGVEHLMFKDSNLKVDKVYKQLSLKYHPDRGGGTEAMQAINDFRRLINEQ